MQDLQNLQKQSHIIIIIFDMMFFGLTCDHRLFGMDLSDIKDI